MKVLSPSELLKRIYAACFGKGEKSPFPILLTTLISALACYFYEMVYGLGCPDTLCEGVYYYRNSNYSTSQARWMIRFINAVHGRNVIIPVLVVLSYCLMTGLAVYLLCRMTKITSRLFQVLLTAMMISFPIVSHHFAFLYMALAYSFSFLMVVLAAAFVRHKKIPGFIAAVFCMLFMMGSYQAYIGAVSALAFVLLIYDAVSGEKIGRALKNFGLYALSGILGTLINIPVSNLMMRIFHVEADGRVAAFAVKDIFGALSITLPDSYRTFFSYFNNEILGRRYLYLVVFALIVVLSIMAIIGKIKERKIVHAVIIPVGLALLPLAMNLLYVIMPSNGMRDLLRYHYVLVFVILFYLHSQIGKKVVNHILQYATLLVMVCLLVGNVITANCTQMMYKFAYEGTKREATLMLERIYELDGYEQDKTPIVLGGFISYGDAQERYPKIFRYAEKEGGPVFWISIYGERICRYHFFGDYMAVNAGDFSGEQFVNIVTSDAYKEMSIWPANGSVEMIDGCAVVKIWEDPPLY